MPASKQLPKACIRDKRGAALCKLRRTVGVRLPADPICDAILQGLSRPLLCTSVRVQRPDAAPGSQWLADPARILDELGLSVDFVVDAGLRAVAPSTVVDLSGPMPRLLRRGKGDWCAPLLPACCLQALNADDDTWRCRRCSEPWLIEGSEDASSKPFVASYDDDEEGEDSDEEGQQDEDAFADWQPEPKARSGRR